MSKASPIAMDARVVVGSATMVIDLARKGVKILIASEELDVPRSRSATPALPFCHLKMKAKKPKDSAYPSKIETLGHRLRAKRMDLGLYQKDAAVLLGVTEDSVCYWENGRVTPSGRMKERILQFVYDEPAD